MSLVNFQISRHGDDIFTVVVHGETWKDVAVSVSRVLNRVLNPPPATFSIVSERRRAHPDDPITEEALFGEPFMVLPGNLTFRTTTWPEHPPADSDEEPASLSAARGGRARAYARDIGTFQSPDSSHWTGVIRGRGTY